MKNAGETLNGLYGFTAKQLAAIINAYAMVSEGFDVDEFISEMLRYSGRNLSLAIDEDDHNIPETDRKLLGDFDVLKRVMEADPSPTESQRFISTAAYLRFAPAAKITWRNGDPDTLKASDVQAVLNMFDNCALSNSTTAATPLLDATPRLLRELPRAEKSDKPAARSIKQYRVTRAGLDAALNLFRKAEEGGK